MLTGGATQWQNIFSSKSFDAKSCQVWEDNYNFDGIFPSLTHQRLCARRFPLIGVFKIWYDRTYSIVQVVVLKALLANRIYSRMTQGKNSSAVVYILRSWNTSSPEVEMVIDGILFVIDDLSFICLSNVYMHF